MLDIFYWGNAVLEPSILSSVSAHGRSSPLSSKLAISQKRITTGGGITTRILTIPGSRHLFLRKSPRKQNGAGSRKLQRLNNHMKKPSDLRIINPQRRAESYKSVVFSDFVFRFRSLNPTATGHGDDVTFFRKTLSFLYQSHFGED